MIVVSDTSPINYLCQIGHIDLLPKLFGRIVVPTAVMAELSASAAPPMVREFSNNPPPWLEIRAPVSWADVLPSIGLGERQAIALVEELRAELLIADDKEARRVAENRQLNVIGTIGVIVLASNRNELELLTTLSSLIDDIVVA